MTSGRLSERQTTFAGENYGVLEAFLNERSLLQEEYYDAVVFSFLKAVKEYDECESLRQYEFSAVADTLMQNALVDYLLEKEQKQKEDVMLLSLDYSFSDSNLTFGDVIADRRVNICDEVCEKLSPASSKYRLLHIYPNIRALSAINCREVM